MQKPVQVTFRGMPVSDAVETACLEEAARLERFYDRITTCRVVVELPHQQHRKGNQYNVKVDIGVPGTELVVDRAPPPHREDEDVHVALREAFDAARRRLEDWVERHRHQGKGRDSGPIARVIRLFDDYGFLQTPGGIDIYFHRNAVRNGGFDTLAVGTWVKYVEHAGNEGPQASSVRPLGVAP